MRLHTGHPSCVLVLQCAMLLMSQIESNRGDYDLSRRYPTPRFLKTETNITAYVGGTAALVCSIENLGTRGVVWYHLPDVSPLTVKTYVYTSDKAISIEHEFESQDWRLIISDVKPHHAGTYECQVASRASFRQHFYLKVLDAMKDKTAYTREATINIYGPDHVNSGESFQVYCNATGVDFTPQEIDWFINGFKIKTDFNKGIVMDKSVSLKTKSIESTLYIASANMSISGDYTCRVSTGMVVTKDVKVLYTSKNNNNKRVSVEKTARAPQEGKKADDQNSGNSVDTCIKNQNINIVLITFFISVIVNSQFGTPIS